MSNNPIFTHDGLWYFWDESWAYQHGPYNTLAECKEALDKYALTLERTIDD